MKAREREPDRKFKCDDIQSVLFGYMTRELGDGQAQLVREHLRHCTDCSRVAAEIQATLDLLRSASRTQPVSPAHLSEDRRKKMRHAVAHPVRHWMEQHHVLTSVLVTAIVLLIGFLVLRRLRIWERREQPQGVTVHINRLPVLETNSPARGQEP
jgi:anti-sigma factor RsiW